MKKVDEGLKACPVTKCLECRYHEEWPDKIKWVMYCSITGKAIRNVHRINKDCPLPDYPKK